MPLIARAYSEDQSHHAISIWLMAVAGLIFVMVVIGGATRLTDSGLSITEWAPIMGAIPPLSAGEWQIAFEKYKQIPEYSEVNYEMSLAAFKEIFWWEWGHRFFGRLIGIAFFVPMVFFALTGQIRGALKWQLPALFVLGGMQGVLGWYMVQSGLSERVDVSQYRLAAHLGLAIVLFGLIVALIFRLRSNSPRLKQTVELAALIQPASLKHWRVAALVLVIAVYGQIILGAFVAGLRAGTTYTDWPLMDGRFFPAGYFSSPARMSDLFETIAAVQFNHRMMAYVLLIGAGMVFWRLRGQALEKPFRWVIGLLTAQALLGIVTLINAVPLWLGLAHQAGALLVLVAVIQFWFVTDRAYSEPEQKIERNKKG